jgi:hypothetical protein
MSAFDVVDVPDFHGTLCAVGNIRQDQVQQLAPRMRSPRRQGSSSTARLTAARWTFIAGRDGNPALAVADEVDDAGWLPDQPVDVSRGSKRPRGVRDGELRGQRGGVPVVSTRDGEVDPLVNGGPSAPGEPPPDGAVGESGAQALLPCQQPTLLSCHRR